MSATCPYCRCAFEEDDEILACPGCATQHHADCFRENGGCTVFGCSAAPADEPKVSVSNHDLATDGEGAAPASFLNLSSPVPASAPPPVAAHIPTPPPPRPAGFVPPPPRLFSSQAPVMTYPTFGSYGPPPPAPVDSYLPRKSHVVFVVLAIFLGAFGGHNFYAGYVKKAVIQLCITVFTCSAGALISWPWAIFEACTVHSDDDGVSFV